MKCLLCNKETNHPAYGYSNICVQCYYTKPRACNICKCLLCNKEISQPAYGYSNICIQCYYTKTKMCKTCHKLSPVTCSHSIIPSILR